MGPFSWTSACGGHPRSYPGGSLGPYFCPLSGFLCVPCLVAAPEKAESRDPSLPFCAGPLCGQLAGSSAGLRNEPELGGVRLAGKGVLRQLACPVLMSCWGFHLGHSSPRQPQYHLFLSVMWTQLGKGLGLGPGTDPADQQLMGRWGCGGQVARGACR